MIFAKSFQKMGLNGGRICLGQFWGNWCYDKAIQEPMQVEFIPIRWTRQNEASIPLGLQDAELEDSAVKLSDMAMILDENPPNIKVSIDKPIEDLPQPRQQPRTHVMFRKCLK